ncbi:MAG TPA: preprotein translocase subunit YajC [Anaeromyxobacter sp.]
MPSVLHAFLAQTAPDGGGASPSLFASPLFMMVAIGAVFYFIIFRPQQKQAKQHTSFIGGLKKGDEVVTQGGIVGTVFLVEDRTVTVDVGGGTKIRVVKNQIAGQWKPVETQPSKAEAKK